MRRREFVQAAAIIPVAAAFPLPLFGRDWKDVLRLEIDQAFSRSPLLQRVLRTDPISESNVLLTRDVRIIYASERQQFIVGSQDPWITIATFVRNTVSDRMEADRFLSSFEHRIGIIEQAILRRAYEAGLPGHVSFEKRHEEFLAMEYGDPLPTRGPYSSWFAGIQPGERSAALVWQCRMRHGV